MMISINGALFVVIGMHLLGSGEWILMPKIIHMTPPSSLESESIRFGLGALSSFGRSTYTARSFTLVSRYCLSTSNSVRTAVITIQRRKQGITFSFSRIAVVLPILDMVSYAQTSSWHEPSTCVRKPYPVRLSEGLVPYILLTVLTVEEVQVIHIIEQRLIDVALCLILSNQLELIHVDKADLHCI